MQIDFADKSASQSISPKVSKYQFDTLKCSLEELAVLERIAQNPAIKQQELIYLASACREAEHQHAGFVRADLVLQDERGKEVSSGNNSIKKLGNAQIL